MWMNRMAFKIDPNVKGYSHHFRGMVLYYLHIEPVAVRNGCHSFLFVGGFEFVISAN